MRVAVGVIVLIASASPLLAQELPRFNVEAYCKEVASFGGSYSAITDQGCFQMEQSAYNTVKGIWAGLPSSVRKYCIEVSTFGGEGNYTTLDGCIRMESEAASSNSNRKFDY